jgi:spermidine synthase
MKRATELERTITPDGSTLSLIERDGDYAIRVNGRELMSTRHYHSEEQLGVVACAPLAALAGACVLVGGLGLGFTLRGALATLRADARVVVAELMAEVVRWNRNRAYPLAAAELADPRTEVVIGDVANVIARSTNRFDAIMLDADNETTQMNTPGNSSLYRAAGLTQVRNALRRGGTVVYWSAGDDPPFAKRLAASGFEVQVRRVRKHPTAGGYHVLFVGHRREEASGGERRRAQ